MSPGPRKGAFLCMVHLRPFRKRLTLRIFPAPPFGSAPQAPDGVVKK